MNILNIVLIETLWNVKKYESTRIWVKKDGINRNIVECKGIHLYILMLLISVLIETSWNVKFL